MKQKLQALGAALMLCATPLFAHDFEVDGIYYNITSAEDKTVEVTFSGDYYSAVDYEYSGSVTIPETVNYNDNTYSVTSIGDEAFDDCTSLTSVVIGNSVTSIGHWAFESCSSLTSVVIGNSVTSIGDWAFESCSSLTSVVIGNSVTSIGSSAFESCSSLTSVEIPNSVTIIGRNAFSYCDGLISVEIGNSVTSIGENAFNGCFSLTSVEIPNSVTSIGESAFESCSSLTSIVVAEDNPIYDSRDNCNAIIETQTNTLIAGCSKTTIPTSVTSIGDYAFFGCDGLTSVEIPNSVTSIGEDAFCGCSSLTSIVVAEDNVIYDSRDNCNAIIKTQTNTLIVGCSVTTIPNSVTSIGFSAFSFCFNLTSVEIPNSVTRIGEAAFSFCFNLTSVEIPNSVTSIGEAAFAYCSGLTSVEIPNSVTSIGDDAFYHCDGLTSVEIPNSVTSIGNFAFGSCASLKTATVGCSWKTNPLYDFDENVTVNATLHSYENGVCTVCGEEETTAIDGITSNAHQRSEIFDLHGRRVNKAGKGLYIINGKKVFLK